MKVKIKENVAIAKTPITCVIRNDAPPPKKSPPSEANKPTAIVPKRPFTPWTAIAPTGSSTLSLSIYITAKSTSIPAKRPIDELKQVYK